MPRENKKATNKFPIDAWEQAWQTHWQKTGFTSYEMNLPDSEAANRERGFKRLGKLGPAVTVFGPVRLKPGQSLPHSR